MKVIILIVNPFGENTYVVYDEKTLECAVIDPGMINEEERNALINTFEKYNLQPVQLINTHMHIDHVLGNGFVSEQYNLLPQIGKEDLFLTKRLQEQVKRFGLKTNVTAPAITMFLDNGDIVHVGDSSLKVLSTPGHSPGSISLYCQESGFVITGDALFRGSIGRTDLPGGDHATLINAIRTQLFSLPDDTIVYPGHGPATTIGAEKRSNPYF